MKVVLCPSLTASTGLIIAPTGKILLLRYYHYVICKIFIERQGLQVIIKVLCRIQPHIGLNSTRTYEYLITLHLCPRRSFASFVTNYNQIYFYGYRNERKTKNSRYLRL